MIRYFLIFCLLGLGWGCGQFGYSEEELVGKWVAVELIQAQDTLNYDLSKVALEFYANHRYTYNGNLAEREAGEYYLMGKILYTKDTLMAKPTEKAVQIEALTADSLQLLMRAKDGIQRLQLIRQ